MEITPEDILIQIKRLEEKEEQKKFIKIYKKLLFQSNHPLLNKIFKHELNMDELDMLKRTKEGEKYASKKESRRKH